MPQRAHPRLSKPPLREALIDIRLSTPLPQSFVQRLNALTLSDLTKAGDIKSGSVTFRLGSEGNARTNVAIAETVGVRFDNIERTRSVQFRSEGITVSILSHYDNWSSFRTYAQELWRIFLGQSGKVTVGRVAVRYVNSIVLPFGEDSDKYLAAGPRIPSELPQIFNSFFSRVIVPVPEFAGHVIITQALEPITDTGFPVILDIDAFSEASFDGADASLWGRLDELRIVKNRAFFSSLTERALEFYR